MPRKSKKKRIARLEVFSGKEAKYNFIIFYVLTSKYPLTCYNVYSEIRLIKGYRHARYGSVNRRISVLYQQGWLKRVGVKMSRSHGLSPLYELGANARAALALSKIGLNDFLKTAPKVNLQMFIDSLTICPPEALTHSGHTAKITQRPPEE